MSKPREWFRIRNAADDTAEVEIYDFIGKSWWDDGGVSAKDFIGQIKGIKAKHVNLRMNSEGGEVFDGIAIYNAIKEHDAHWTVNVQGMALSIASVIAMAGDEIRMAKNAFMMIHNASGFAIGTHAEMAKAARMLKKIDGKIAQTYADRGDKSEEEFAALMADETWLTAEEASDLGLVDSIDGESEDAPQRVAACLTNCRYRNIPESVKNLAATVTAASKPPTEVRNVAKNESTEAVAEDAEDQAATDAEDTVDTDGAAESAAETQATAQAVKPATIAQLRKALPTASAEFVLACVEGGMTEAQAKIMHAAQPAANAKPKAGGPGLRGGTGVPQPAGDYMAQVDAYQAQNKCSRRDALRNVARANPTAHEEWCKAQGKVQMTSEATIGRDD